MSSKVYVVHLIDGNGPRCGAPTFHNTTDNLAAVTCMNCRRAADMEDMTTKVPVLREEARTGTDD